MRRAEIEVVTAGLEPGPVRASRGVVLVPDRLLDEVLDERFDMIVLPGGLPGADHLDLDPRIQDLVRRIPASGGWAAAICAAPKVLAHAGLLDGREATAYPGVLKGFDRVHALDVPVAEAGRIITSRGPGTAMDFALTLVERLAGRERREVVEAGLVRP